MTQKGRKAPARKASVRAEGKARGKRNADVQAEDETEGKAKKPRADPLRRKLPRNGPWVCELRRTKLRRLYDLARHNRTKHKGSDGSAQCECGAI